MNTLFGICPICRKHADKTDIVIVCDVTEKLVFLHRACVKVQFDASALTSSRELGGDS